MRKNIFATQVGLVLALSSITVLMGSGAAAQVPSPHQHYKLFDLGTLGGPHSYGSINGDGFQLLNNSGIVGSYAEAENGKWVGYSGV